MTLVARARIGTFLDAVWAICFFLWSRGFRVPEDDPTDGGTNLEEGVEFLNGTLRVVLGRFILEVAPFRAHSKMTYVRIQLPTLN